MNMNAPAPQQLAQDDVVVNSNIDVRKNRKNWRSLSLWNVLSYAVLLIIAAVYIGPLAMLVNTSFMTQQQFNRDATSLPKQDNFADYFDNFEEAWEEANFPQYMANTIFYATTATLIYVVSAVFLAFPIARGYIRGGNTTLLLFVIALFLPPALIPQFQLILNLGL